MMIDNMSVAVVGVGHVGLPVAIAFAKKYKVLGFDINKRRITSLASGVDENQQFGDAELKKAEIEFTADPKRLGEAGFIIISVPTSVDGNEQPNLELLKSAVKIVGKHMKKAAVVVFESTVFPGTTEEFCIPLLEEFSGFEAGVEFFVGYSPERSTPGNNKTPITKIRKVVAGQSEAVLEFIAEVYGNVVDAGVFKAKSIRIAEAAKVIENTQQDINIALVNELALIFHSLGIDTGDVLQTAGTKKSFLNFTPGFAGGPHLGVDSHYLAYKARAAGYHPEIILAARRINGGVGKFIARTVAKKLAKRGLAAGTKVTVLGVTYKENNGDLRNSSVVDVIWELEEYGFEVQVSDSCAEKDEANRRYGLYLTPEQELLPAAAVILATPHDLYKEQGWAMVNRLLDRQGGLVFDIKGILSRIEKPEKVELWRL